MTVLPISKPPLFHPEAADWPDRTVWRCTDCDAQVLFDHVCMVVPLRRSLEVAR